jgi:hypothetical protein
MVKEGHDSTVRPKVQTYEFDGGRLLLDSWAADGKPNLSRNFQGWLRVFGVLSLTGAGTVLLLTDWSGVSKQHDHVFSDLQRGVRAWWSTFMEMDEADVAKARSVQRQPKPGIFWSLFASEKAHANLAKGLAKASESAPTRPAD